MKQYTPGKIAQMKKRALAREDPHTTFKKLAEKLGGPEPMAKFLGCSRATAYNILSGRARWTHKFLHKALQEISKNPIVEVDAECRAGFDIPKEDWQPRRPHSLSLDCDGAFIVSGNSMWPLVGDGQYVLYRNVTPEELRVGDIVLARLRSGETLIKAWYPMDREDDEDEADEKEKKGQGEVFLASLYRGPEAFRKELFRPFKLEEFEQLRKVVGIWLS
jgi:hypothetical protein